MFVLNTVPILVGQRAPLFAVLFIGSLWLGFREVAEPGPELAFWLGLTAETSFVPSLGMALFGSLLALFDWILERHRARGELLPPSTRFGVFRAAVLGTSMLVAVAIARLIVAYWSIAGEMVGIVDVSRTLFFIATPALAAGLAFFVSRVLMATDWRLCMLAVWLAVALLARDHVPVTAFLVYVPVVLPGVIRRYGYDDDHALPGTAVVPGVIGLVALVVAIDFGVQQRYGKGRRDLKAPWLVASQRASEAYFEKRLPTAAVVSLGEVLTGRELFEIDASVTRASLVGPIGRPRFGASSPTELEQRVEEEPVPMDLLEVVETDAGEVELERLVVRSAGVTREAVSTTGDDLVLRPGTRIAAQRPGVVVLGHEGDGFIQRVERSGRIEDETPGFSVERLDLPEGERFEGFVESYVVVELSRVLPGPARVLAVRTGSRLWAPFVRRPIGDEEPTFVDCTPLRVLEVDAYAEEPYVALGRFDGTPWDRVPIPSRDRSTDLGADLGFPFADMIWSCLRSPIVLATSMLGEETTLIGRDRTVRQYPWALVPIVLVLWGAWFVLRWTLTSQRAPRQRRRAWTIGFVLFGLPIAVACVFWEWWGRGEYPVPKHKGAPRLVLRSEPPLGGRVVTGS